MVAQVNPMSAYHCRAGTRKWTTPISLGGGPSGSQVSVIGSLQSPQEVCTVTRRPASVATPNISQAQLAHHDRSPLSTLYAVGMAENGPAIQISPERGSTRTVFPIRSVANASRATSTVV